MTVRIPLLILPLTTSALAAPGWIEVGKEGGFVVNPSGAAFIPWGFNYELIPPLFRNSGIFGVNAGWRGVPAHKSLVGRSRLLAQ